MGLNTPRLETERLILRKFTQNDLDALFSIFRDEEANRFLPWYPLHTMEEARSFFLERMRPPMDRSGATGMPFVSAPTTYLWDTSTWLWTTATT